MDATTDVDLNFEPQIRARSNTWPLRPREVEPQNSPTHEEASAESQAKDSLTVNKKTSSRRNAWGNLSYADLITKAIQSSPDQRLTLSQIYDWMVQNVPYFKDKGDSTSSAGWKNSIRHNLSLHSRFMRVPNEGSGKSSWWVINPDAKPGKTPRRRAGSMETKVYEKKKNRAKKKAEQLRALEQGSNSPSASSDGDILSDSPVPAFQLSPDFDFRPRASSNASSCGRLSPIQAAAEPDLHDNQVPPMSPIHWNSTEMETEGVNSLDTFADQLVDTLAGSMTLSDKNLQQQLFETGNGDSFTVPQYNQEASFNQYRDYATPPPPYPEHLCQSPQPQVSHQKQQQAQSQPQQQHLTQLTSMESLSLSSHDNYSMGLGMQNGSGIKLYSQAQDQLFQQGSLVGAEPTLSTGIVDSSQQLSAQESQPQSQLHSISCSQPHTSSHDRKSPLSTPVALMGTYQVCKPQQSPQSRVSPHQRSPQTSPQPKLDSSLVQQHLQTTNNSILRAALMQNPQPIRVPPCTSPSQSYSNQYSAELFGNPITSYTCGNGGTVSTNSISNCRLMNQASAGRGSQLSTCMNGGVSSQLSQVDTTICPTMNLQLPAGHSSTIMDVQSQATQAASSRNQLNEIFPTDIDIEMLWNSTNLECDMAAVIEHELSLNENLDFNFDPLSGMAPVADSQNTIQ